MKKPFVIGILVFIGLLAAGYGLVISNLSGPKVQGKRVVVWMDELASRDQAIKDKAKQTVQNNAKDFLPHLVAMMSAKDSEERLKWATVLNVDHPPSYALRLGANRGFALLGSAAAPVTSQLIPLLASKDAGLDVAGALGSIGKEAVAPLIQQLSNADAQARSMAAAALSRMKPADAAPAAEALVKGMADKETSVRTWMIAAVGKTQAKPDESIPLLIAMLDEKESGIIASAATALGDFGPAAKAALPKLTALSKVRNEEISGAASGALNYINPAPAEAQPEPKKPSE
jgi:HEAT repeat protein